MNLELNFYNSKLIQLCSFSLKNYSIWNFYNLNISKFTRLKRWLCRPYHNDSKLLNKERCNFKLLNFKCFKIEFMNFIGSQVQIVLFWTNPIWNRRNLNVCILEIEQLKKFSFGIEHNFFILNAYRFKLINLNLLNFYLKMFIFK